MKKLDCYYQQHYLIAKTIQQTHILKTIPSTHATWNGYEKSIEVCVKTLDWTHVLVVLLLSRWKWKYCTNPKNHHRVSYATKTYTTTLFFLLLDYAQQTHFKGKVGEKRFMYAFAYYKVLSNQMFHATQICLKLTWGKNGEILSGKCSRTSLKYIPFCVCVGF